MDTKYIRAMADAKTKINFNCTDGEAILIANEFCVEMGFFWRAHGPAHWELTDTDYWFGFTHIGFTGWNGRSEYEGHGKTLTESIANAIAVACKEYKD
jgi:hypothetical protein